MLGYVTIGALDVEAALPFYDAVLGATGCPRSFFDQGWAGYGPAGEDPNIMICPPFDKQPARAGNGIMIAFKAPTQAAVDTAYAQGLAHGGTDEGAPGNRPPGKAGWYGAYLRDPTGNKICVYTTA